MHRRQEKEDLKVLRDATEKLVAKYEASDKTKADDTSPPPNTAGNAGIDMAAIRAAICRNKTSGGSK